MMQFTDRKLKINHQLMRLIFLFSIAAFVTLSACKNNFIYEKSQDVPNGQWTWSDTLNFKFPVQDTTALYNLYVDISYADDYPSQNVYMKLYTRFPDGKRQSKVLSFDLFDAQGQPNGKCSGNQCTVRMQLQNKAFFKQAGDYELTFEQNTRRDTLPGIRAIGFAVEQLKEKR